MKQIIGIIVFCIQTSVLFATHNRAGEITYKQLSAYTYEITLVTYTYTPSYANETRDVLPIDWGDGTMSNIPRVQVQNLPDNYTKNTYRMTHTFPGPGNYRIIMEDPNRNQGVANIFDSVNIPFSVSTTLRIDAILGNNSTPILLNPPVDKAALGQRFVHNPAAYDPDGDSLSYAITICTGQNGDPIPNYTFPQASKHLYVDSISGDLIWDAPVALGIYNVAMVVKEWRKGVLIGQVVRDIQIEVFQSNNTTPTIAALPNVCVRANDTVRFMVQATDVDNNFIMLTASGGPLDMVSSKAQFTTVSGIGAVQSEFVWIPSCNEIREQPYTVLFKVTDAGNDVALAGFQYVSIQVIGHAPVAIQTESKPLAVQLDWSDTICSNQLHYLVYRSPQSVPYSVSYCETGLPTSLQNSYSLVQTIPASQNNLYDVNNGLGLSPGFTYCYRIISTYADDVPSYISNEVCVELKPTVHVMTNVSVQKTDKTMGEMYIAWSLPRDFDSILFPKPYVYKVYRSYGFVGANKVQIATISGLYDTSFVDTGIPTQDSVFSYTVELYSLANASTVLIGTPPACSSPYISLVPHNKKVSIRVQTQVGWQNDSMYVYRKQIDDNTFELIGTSTTNQFIDTGLVNLQEYCYYVITSGYFDNVNLPARVYNSSQIACCTPADTVPPLAPVFKVVQYCDSLYRKLTWTIDSTDEIEKVCVYYKNCKNQSYVRIATLSSQYNEFIHIFHDTVMQTAGCYYITSIDSAENESQVWGDTCLYNCPKYVLPNIFTPNADGQNDIYHPVVNRFVEYVDMKIYDSWGNLIFETKDPKILWKGFHGTTKKPLDDGVYYYVCDVYEYWSDCQVHPRTLVGFIHMFSDGKKILQQNE